VFSAKVLTRTDSLVPAFAQTRSTQLFRIWQRDGKGRERRNRSQLHRLVTENNTANRKGNDNETYPQQQQQ